MDSGIFLLGLLFGLFFSLGFECARLYDPLRKFYERQLMDILYILDDLKKSIRKLEKFRKKIESMEDDGK